MSFTRVVEESVRLYLSEQRSSGDGEPAPLPVLTQPALRAGVNLDDTSRLWELE